MENPSPLAEREEASGSHHLGPAQGGPSVGLRRGPARRALPARRFAPRGCRDGPAVRGGCRGLRRPVSDALGAQHLPPLPSGTPRGPGLLVGCRPQPPGHIEGPGWGGLSHRPRTSRVDIRERGPAASTGGTSSSRRLPRGAEAHRGPTVRDRPTHPEPRAGTVPTCSGLGRRRGGFLLHVAEKEHGGSKAPAPTAGTQGPSPQDEGPSPRSCPWAGPRGHRSPVVPQVKTPPPSGTGPSWHPRLPPATAVGSRPGGGEPPPPSPSPGHASHPLGNRGPASLPSGGSPRRAASSWLRPLYSETKSARVRRAGRHSLRTRMLKKKKSQF